MMGSTAAAVMAAACAHVLLGGGLGAFVPASHSAGPTSSFAAVNPDAPIRGRVSGIAVAPVAAGAEIVIALDSGVSVNHFTLDGPSRLVLDLGGASLSLRGVYDGRARGPVRNVRLAQYRIRVGQQLGRLRVSGIKQRTVQFTIEEFGFNRQETLAMAGDTTKVRNP